MNLQENRRRSPNFRQIQLQQFRQFLLPIKHFRIFHGRLFRLNGSLTLINLVVRNSSDMAGARRRATAKYVVESGLSRKTNVLDAASAPGVRLISGYVPPVSQIGPKGGHR
jgi:hypothetical protein